MGILDNHSALHNYKTRNGIKAEKTYNKKEPSRTLLKAVEDMSGYIKTADRKQYELTIIAENKRFDENISLRNYFLNRIATDHFQRGDLNRYFDMLEEKEKEAAKKKQDEKD